MPYPVSMAYKIPRENDVADALLIVMHKNPQIKSQRELTELVKRQLSHADSEYRVSGERIRRIGLNKGLIRISIDYNSSNAETLPDICPVCRNRMVSIKNRTLDGGVIEVRRRCELCKFSTGPEPTVPGRYHFTKKG
jgi:hypothetical protein